MSTHRLLLNKQKVVFYKRFNYCQRIKTFCSKFLSVQLLTRAPQASAYIVRYRSRFSGESVKISMMVNSYKVGSTLKLSWLSIWIRVESYHIGDN